MREIVDFGTFNPPPLNPLPDPLPLIPPRATRNKNNQCDTQHMSQKHTQKDRYRNFPTKIEIRDCKKTTTKKTGVYILPGTALAAHSPSAFFTDHILLVIRTRRVTFNVRKLIHSILGFQTYEPDTIPTVSVVHEKLLTCHGYEKHNFGSYWVYTIYDRAVERVRH